jgi:hypothetical protein
MSERNDHSLQPDAANGGPAPAAPATPPPSGTAIIPLLHNPVRDVLFPIFLVVIFTLIVGILASLSSIGCNNYMMLILSYSLLFGAGGMILGGALRVQGQFKPFGIPWTVDAAGGIAAALLAGLVAYSLKPACQFDSKIRITNLPLREPETDSPVTTFVTVETDSNVIIQRGTNKGTLNLNFDDSEPFTVTLRAYKQEGQGYKFLASCEVQFDSRAELAEETKDDTTVYWLREDSPLSFSFDAGYFKLLADSSHNSAVDNIQNTCLKGSFRSTGASLEPATIVTPVHLVHEKIAQVGPRRASLSVFFTKKKLPEPPNSKAALKEVAQTGTSPTNEVLTPPGTGSPVSSDGTAAVKGASQPIKAIAVVAPTGCLDDAATRALVDSFLNGDDLDQDTRRDKIYRNWPEINCYVLPIAVRSDPAVSSLQHSRALKLLINAIINNSTIKDAPLYWQPNGENLRDFKMPLPYIGSEDIQRIFGLIPSDDALIRAEALRFVKLLPVDELERLFRQKLHSLKTMPPDLRGSNEAIDRFAVAGVSLYYNRIVEWLDGSADQTIRNAIDTDFAAGMDWAVDSLFNGRSAKPYEATLLYARGIVEREQKLADESGPLYQATFAKMLVRLKQTEDTYPSRQLHIAQALAFANIPDPALKGVLKQIQSADQLTPPVALDDSSPFNRATPAMYAGPSEDPSTTVGTNAATRDGENLLLRLGDWYFVRGAGKIGWIKKP